jgi:4-hydroxyproline epimerase
MAGSSPRGLEVDMRINVVDSHTGGEPTRLVIAGGPELGRGPLEERRKRFRETWDHLRSGICNEPRGSAAMVGGLLCEPDDPSCTAAVIFFNNVGYLGMCGHGTIGLIVTLAYLGRIGPGEHRVETPVGTVEARLHPDGRVSVRNVPAFRARKGVRLEVPGYRAVTGDVAWGGNWFFLVQDHGRELKPDRIEELTAFSGAIRGALRQQGVTGEDGAEIDHIELVSAHPGKASARSFVLCPGGAYDRSPCGTGTSAKVACLAQDGLLRPGECWQQESVIGSVFEATFEWDPQGRAITTITGAAHVTAESVLVLDPTDPFRWGFDG